MTERFSPEYIKFILSDEASVLQEGREWTLGDWWFVDRETGQVGLLAIKPDDKIIFVKKEAISWLPTLSDLLGMIEEAGWEWQRWPDQWRVYEKGVPLNCIILDCKDTDDMTIAAKLAVRVLEERE